MHFSNIIPWVTTFSLKAIVDSVKFDILLAPNYALLQTDKIRRQHQMLLSKFNLTSTWADLRPYSCSFCETVVDFIQKKNEIIHSAIRLAKFWMHSLVLIDHRYGYSFATELIICYASKLLEERNITLGVSNIFNEFLRQLYNWQSLHAYWTDYYTIDHIPSRLQDWKFLKFMNSSS